MLGKLDVRFPSMGIEREFRQRELEAIGSKEDAISRRERVRLVLAANPHLAQRVCYVLHVGALPAYVLVPTGSQVRDHMLDGLVRSERGEGWCLVIGRLGPVCRPDMCGGLLAPIVACDQIYSFDQDEWRSALHARLSPALTARKVKAETFATTSRDLFDRISTSLENLGATDEHRALNYLLMQHPGIFLSAAERVGKQVLDRVETRHVQGLASRRLINVILTFLDLATGVPERLFCRVDVTEEWPFLADDMDGRTSPLGLLPYVEGNFPGIPL
ncbi:MAG: hypothetical protein ABW277_08210 [Longimicrobiaceae bacterium]